MISRCKWCNSVCPDFSDVCDGCANIEFECDKVRREMLTSVEKIMERIQNKKRRQKMRVTLVTRLVFTERKYYEGI